MKFKHFAADDMRFIFHNQKKLFVDGNCGGFRRDLSEDQLRIYPDLERI